MTTFSMTAEGLRRNELLQQLIRLDADSNGNPRWYVPGYLVPVDRARLITAKLGLTRYRGKRFGGGYVLQSYAIHSDVKELARIVDLSDYEAEAEQFLSDSAAAIRIVRAEKQTSPGWAKDGQHGIEYTVTLTTKRGSYTFSFWGSVADRDKKVDPTAYSVLAAIGHYTGETFDEFCDNYGLSSDSIHALTTYNAMVREASELARIFTRQQLNELRDIQ